MSMIANGIADHWRDTRAAMQVHPSMQKCLERLPVGCWQAKDVAVQRERGVAHCLDLLHAVRVHVAL